MAHDRPAQKDEAADKDERDGRQQRAQAGGTAALALVAEGTEREDERYGAEEKDDEAYRHDADRDANKFGVHRRSLSLAVPRDQDLSAADLVLESFERLNVDALHAH